MSDTRRIGSAVFVPDRSPARSRDDDRALGRRRPHAAAAELYRNLKPQQASRALNALRDIGVVERAARGRWYIIDPPFRRYLAARRVERLSFVQTAWWRDEISHAFAFIET